MSGHFGPITCCDSECAGVNHCTIGGVQCERCGKYFCAGELDENGHCDECSDKNRTCENCGEEFWEDDGVVDEDGDWFCSDECLKEWYDKWPDGKEGEDAK